MSAESRKTQDRFACVACGHQDHADLNAARNILQRGIAAWNDGRVNPTNQKRHGARGICV